MEEKKSPFESWDEVVCVVVEGATIGLKRKKLIEKELRNRGANVVSLDELKSGSKITSTEKKKSSETTHVNLIISDLQKSYLDKILSGAELDLSTIVYTTSEVLEGKDKPKIVSVKDLPLKRENEEDADTPGSQKKAKIEQQTEVEKTMDAFAHDGKKAYACQRKAVMQHKNMDLAHMFEELCAFQGVNVDDPQHAAKTLAYERALSVIRAWPAEISLKPDGKVYMQKLKNAHLFGKTSYEKTVEFLRTGTCQKLEEFRKSEKLMSLRELSDLYGVGIKSAVSFYEKGIRSKEDLKEALNSHLIKVNPNVKFVLENSSDICDAFTWEDVSNIFVIIKDALQKFNLEFEVCGGFRRKKHAGHDLDVLITPKVKDNAILAHSEAEPFIDISKFNKAVEMTEDELSERRDSVIEDLEATLDIVKLTGFTTSDDNFRKVLSYIRWKPSIYSLKGAATQKNLYKRVDLIFVPTLSWPFAVLGWSGSRFFEKSLRFYVANVFRKDGKTFRLDSNGLFELNEADQAVQFIYLKTEKEIFEFLGLEYLSPEERCH